MFSEAQWGFDFDPFSGARGAKIKKLFEKKSKLSYKLKQIVSKLFREVISTLYNCSKRINTVWNLIRGFLRGSKRIKMDEFFYEIKGNQ